MADEFDSLLQKYPQYGGGSGGKDNGFDSLLKKYPNYTPPLVPQASPVTPVADSEPSWGDYGYGMMKGFANIPTTVGTGVELAGRGLGLPSVEKAGQAVRGVGQEAENYWQDQMTQAGQNPQGTWNKIKMGAAESLPGTVAMAIPAFGFAKGAQALGAGAKIGGLLGGSERAMRIGSTLETAIPAGLTEGAFSGLQNAAQTGQDIRDQTKYSDEMLAQHPAFADALARNNGDASAAREDIARQAESQVFNRTAPWTAAAGILTGGGILGQLPRQMVDKGIVGAAKGALKGALAEGYQEAVQSPGEQYIQNLTTKNLVNEKQDVWEGVPESAVIGFGAGALMGGPLGGLHGAMGEGDVPSPDAQEQGAAPLPQNEQVPGQNLGPNPPPDFDTNANVDMGVAPNVDTGIETSYSDTNPFMWDQRGVRTPSGMMPLYDFYEYQIESGMDAPNAYRATLARAKLDFPLTPDEQGVVKTSELPQLQAAHQRALQQSIALATPPQEDINYGETTEIPTDAVQPWQAAATQTGQGQAGQEALLETREQQQGQQGLQQPAREGQQGQGPGQEVRFSRAPVGQAPVEQGVEQAPRFYSQLRRVVEAAPPTALGTGAQFKQWLNGGTPRQMGVKEDEIHWSGINDYLDSNKKTRLTKDDVLSFLDRPESGAATQDIVLTKAAKDKEADAEENWLSKRSTMQTMVIPKLSASDAESIYRLASLEYRGDKEATQKINALNLSAEERKVVREYGEAINVFVKEKNNSKLKPKYVNSDYQLPGGKNYEELVVTAPNAEAWGAEDNAHYGDVGKGQAVAWARMDTREDDAGNEGIMLHEIQSKRSMEGRAKGFKTGTGKQEIKIDGISTNQTDDGTWEAWFGDYEEPWIGDTEAEAYRNAVNEMIENGYENVFEDSVERGGVPPAPYVTTAKGKPTDAYVSLLMKKAVSKAVDEGKSFVAWTRGDQQADFYDLSKKIDEIGYTDNGDGTVDIQVSKNADVFMEKSDLDKNDIEELFGEGIAQKIFNGEGKEYDEWKLLSGLDLKTPPPKWTGQMYGDESGKSPTGELSIITQAASDLAKKYGGQIGMVKTKTGSQPALIITPQMRKRIKGEGMARFSKKKPLAAEQTNSEAFKAWSYDAPLIKSSDAETYDFKSGQKVVVEAFHGTGRPDRVGETFKKKRATSGPMSFFSSNPSVSSGYAQGKADTSLALEDQAYETWFKYKPKGWRGNPVDIVRAWYSLSTEDKAKIAERMPDIRQDDDGNITYEKEQGDPGSYQWELQQTQRGYDKRGNPLKAAVETWLNGGVLFGYEEEFMQVLKLAGFPMKDVTYDSPQDTFPFVYKTYIRMRKPLVTNDMPEEVVDALKTAAKRDRTRAKQSGADMWDKNTRTLKEWVANFLDPNNPTQSYVWTSIPDKVTDVFKSLGYDGIIDWGGKGGGKVAPVYIPFEETQIKSAIGNKGTFNEKSNILRSKGGTPAPYTSLTGFRRAFAQQLDKEMGAGWTESLLKTGLVKFIPKNQVARILNGGEALFHAAWHGSPHNFEKFKKEGIGTGEGAQAFGYGLYFTDAKSIAEWYRDNLTYDRNSHNDKIFKNANINIPDNIIDDIANIIKSERDKTWEWTDEDTDLFGEPNPNKNISFTEAQKESKDLIKYLVLGLNDNLAGYFALGNASEKQIKSILNSIDRKSIDSIEYKGPKYTNGKLYQVELAPTQDEYLLFDEPLSNLSGLAKTAIFEGSPNSISRNAKFLSDLVKSEPFISKGFGGLDVPTQNRVLKEVFAAGQNDKVLKSIIRLIPVDVMNILKREKLSTDKLFHNESMFHDLLSSSSNLHIAGWTNVASALTDSAARAATENSLTSRGDRGSFDRDTTGGAKINVHIPIVQELGQKATGRDLYYALSKKLGSEKAASEYLYSIGIRGIRYKAEGGKSAANNYVIFSDEDISIQAKYSQGMYSGVKAFYNPADQQTYFVFDNIGQNEDLYKLSLHELANHALQLNKSDKEFQSILKQFAALRATDKGVQAAYARVPKDTAKNLIDEEGLGYFLETHPNHSLTKRLVAWLRKMIRSLATHWPVLQRAKFAKWANDLTTDDLISMARDALAMAPAKLGERAGGESVLASKAPAEDLVSLFKALSPRAKPATRQAAEARIDDHPQADAIRYVEQNFYDLLSRMEESGEVKIEC